MGDFTMPSLGADMERGTLLEWRVGVGDRVEKGDIVAVVDTEKSAIDVEVFESGVVEELLVEPGTEVAVGTSLARIRSAAEQPVEPSPPEHDDGPATSPPVVAGPAATPGAVAGATRERPPVTAHEPNVHSPLIRRLAERLDVDTDQLVGSGPGHRITRDDVERAAAERTVARAEDHLLASAPMRTPDMGASPLARRRAAEQGIDLSDVTGTGPQGAVRARDLSTTPGSDTSTAHGPDRSSEDAATDRRASIRRAIARQMSTSNREIPHYHLARTLDVNDAMEWLTEHNEGRGTAERVLPAALLIRATALAAARHPDLNGSWVDDTFRPAEGVHLAVAVALRGGGLQTPVIHHADELDLDRTMTTLRDLVARTRRGSLRASELSGASLTVTDLGDRGADSVHGIIHPPQVALVGFGRIAARPWAVDGMLGVRRTVVATLAADHRASDGHTGSALLGAIDDLLCHPSEL